MVFTRAWLLLLGLQHGGNICTKTITASGYRIESIVQNSEHYTNKRIILDETQCTEESTILQRAAKEKKTVIKGVGLGIR